MSFFSGSAKTSVHMLQEIKVACVFLGGGLKVDVLEVTCS